MIAYSTEQMRELVRRGDPPRNAATIEHLRRRADGGTDRLDNLAIACLQCNYMRGTMSWVEFKTQMSVYAPNS